MTSDAMGPQEGFRSGFVSLIGRPNVGKSTLLNAIVDHKVAIVSNKPQTTRNAIRGILDREAAQIIFVDTPGLHKAKNLLGQRLNEVVRASLAEMDVGVFVLDASKEISGGDRFIATELSGVATPILCVITKADLVTPDVLLRQIEAARQLGEFIDVLTTSSPRGTGLEDVVSTIEARLPEGPRFYPHGAVSDSPEKLVVAEMVREKVLRFARQEVPHSVAVVVEEMEPREGTDLTDIQANVFVIRDSQKGIIIGKKGAMLKKIGSAAREDIEAKLGGRVFLELRVKVEPRWQKDAQLLDRMGY